MRWLLDQGIPRSTASFLREVGHQSEHVGDIGLAKAADAEIMKVAVDRGFFAIAGASAPSVVRIREEGLKGDSVARIISAIFSVAEEALGAGCVVSYGGGNVRLRMLPIVASPS
jgi:predicted nuclease of predicted toxin-antitoxin system